VHGNKLVAVIRTIKKNHLMVKSFSTRTINKRTIKIAIINEDYENAAILNQKFKRQANKKLSLLVTNIKV
jgi:hypothetical protein